MTVMSRVNYMHMTVMSHVSNKTSSLLLLTWKIVHGPNFPSFQTKCSCIGMYRHTMLHTHVRYISYMCAISHTCALYLIHVRYISYTKTLHYSNTTLLPAPPLSPTPLPHSPTCMTHSMRYSCAIGSLHFTTCSSTFGKMLFW